MPKKTGAKKATFGADLIEGMNLVLAEADRRQGHSQAGENVPGRILASLWHQQARLAGVGAGRYPDSAARAYLTVIAKEPAVVRRALASE